MIRRWISGLVTCLFIFSLPSIQALANSDDINYDKLDINYDKLLPTAKKYIGVPYVYGGTDSSGFDCSGYMITVFETLGIDLPRTSKSQFNTGTPVKKENLRVGDLVFFNTSGNGVSHAGIYIGKGQFIHSSSSKGVSISSLNDPYYWSKKYIGAKRILAYSLDLGQFNDIEKSYWAYEAISELSKKELMIGFEDSNFRPLDPIKRADVAAYLAEYLDLDFANRSEIFKDVTPDHWAIGAVNALYNEGIDKGDNGLFRASDTVTRAELAVFFARAFELSSGNAPMVFTDVPESHWAYKEIQSLAASGISTGYPDGTFNPDGEVNRAQFAAFFYRAITNN